MKSFIKNLMFGKKGVSPDIKSVKPTTNIAGSVSKVKKDAAFKNFKTVQGLKKKKNEGKKMMQEAQKELRRAVETKRATKIGKSIYHRNVPADSTDLRNEASVKAFKMAKGKDLEKKAKGGRVGLKRGTGLMKKKSNVQKIKETFGPKNKSTKFGMLSVKAGIDKNPNPTQADRIAGAKMKNRMKAAFGGGADMGKVASDKTKTEVKKYEKRAKDASKFLKNKGRSFGSIMREKYMR